MRVTLIATLLALLGASLLALLSGCECAAPPRTEIPELRASRASGAITIDGRLDEAAWQSAAVTERFVDTMSGAAASPRATARVTWDDDALYVAFEVEDSYLRSTFEHQDDHTWEQDCVELMIDPDGDGRSYVELQVSPRNVTFDTWFDSRRVPQPFGHIDWDTGMRTAVDVRGTLNDESSDEGYVAELAIPWSAFASIGVPAARPEGGETWRVAMYVLDAVPNGQGGVGWSPPLVGDFHVPERFGRVMFAR